jgi:phosphoribosylamine--glycine ligase
MRILLVGNGGRENALAWRLAKCPNVEHILCPGGNPGIARYADVSGRVPSENGDWVSLARTAAVDLVVVGPEAPLAAGLADQLQAAGFPVFGPVRAGALLEASKAHSKALMERAGVPTAASRTFEAAAAAKNFARDLGLPVVIKADGLAAGKGVTVATTWAEADAAIDENLVGARFGESSARIVVEEFMEGEEASVFGLCDGRTVFPLVAAQDHKRIFDGDLGPNTGGMGAYAPAPIATPEVMEQTMRLVFEPTVAALRADGVDYRGVLYAGLMIKDGKVRVVEFNCRFGDPETQVVLPLLEGDFAGLLMACATGRLAEFLATGAIQTSSLHAITVVLASGGYPGEFERGLEIRGVGDFDGDPNRMVFHAGTMADAGVLRTNGGRVLACTAWESTLARARQRAYEMARGIQFDGMHFRTDIAHRALGKDQ